MVVTGTALFEDAYDKNKELCVERFLFNPYWQYFCGYEYFQHTYPLEPTSLVKWCQN
jgi:IS5 family transposase